jgi:SSS family solute:Na+ symporter/sodium/pantothenate symporter
MEVDPDRTMPDFAARLTRVAGMPWLAGLLVAAPFAAVMSSVDSFLLLVSSSVVRDVYQKHVRADAPERTLKRLSHVVTITVGVMAVLMVVNPPLFLQDLIVFASGGLAACFLVPVLFSLYWPRMTGGGVIAGMLGGTLMHVGLTLWGYGEIGEFRAYEFLGFSPFVWDLIASASAACVVSLTGTVDREKLAEFFD